MHSKPDKMDHPSHVDVGIIMDTAPKSLDNSAPENKQGFMVMDTQKKLGIILISIVLAIIAILSVLNISIVYEPLFLLLILNTVFIGIISIIIASITNRVFVKSGSVSVFLIGSGLLIFGLGSIVTGWFLPLTEGLNVGVTIHNTCAFAGSVFILAGAGISTYGRRIWKGSERTWIVTGVYSGILVFVALFSLVTMQGMVPPFFIQGVGPTVLRQVILENTVMFFAISSVLFMFTYFRRQTDFFFWYSISFALISIGLLAVLIPQSVGSLLGWAGRSAQYLGFVFALYAVLVTRRAATTKGLLLEEAIANIFVDAEQSYTMLVETATDAIVTFDDTDRILLWNSGAERIFGYTRDEAIGLSFPELLMDNRYIAVIKNEDMDIPLKSPNAQVPKSIEISGKHKDGTFFPVELTVSLRIQEGKRIHTCILRDLTERKRLEEELHAANEGLEEKVQEKTEEIECTIESLRRTHEQLLASYKQVATDKEELRLQYDEIRNKTVALEASEREIRTLNQELERRVEERTQELQRVNVKLRAINEELTASEEELRVQIDMTNETYDALEKSETRFHSMFERHDSVMLLIDPETEKIIDANLAAERFYGKLRTDLRKQFIHEINILPPEEIATVMVKAVREKNNRFIFFHRIANGEVRMVEVHSSPIDIGGKTILFSIIYDITDRIRTEEELLRISDDFQFSRDYAQSIVDTVREPLIVLNGSFEVISASRSFYTIFEVMPEATLGKVLYTLGDNQWDIPPLHEMLEMVLPQSTSFDNFEIEHDFPGIGHRNMLLNARRILSETGTTKLILLVIEDITNRIRTEEELLRISDDFQFSRDYAQSIVDTVREPLIVLNGSFEVISASRAFYTTFEVSPEATIGKVLYTLGDNQWDISQLHEMLETVLPDSTSFDNFEIEHDFPGIGHRNMLLNARRILSETGTTELILLVIEDITERKKMSEQIKSSLTEKETLLREIHHRVKNNLQIIISLLNLQIRRMDDPVTMETLKDCQNRVRSMALVHEHLYKGKDISRIDLGNYLNALGMGLFQSYEDGRRGIRFDIGIRDIYVDINIAIPLGLISNELIINSLKYAFSEKTGGILSLSATEDSETLILTVADNGGGIPEGITLENQDSMGLRLVEMFTDQLNASVMIDRTEGTKFTFTIPKPKEQKPTVGDAK